ncbi:VID27 cytoplasmic protein, partial [Helicosporidium sp. ATCC 50920]
PVASTPPQAGERLNVAPGSRTLLARGERALHLITPSRLGRLTHADVETGRVVNDFSFVREGVEDYGVADICNETKTAQLEDRSTFLGLSSKSLLRWDTRLKGGLAQEMTSPAVECLGGKSYKLSESSGFTCMATSADGYVAVGARDGRVRLYSERTLTQARTSIPGLGAPITGIDVTFDGQWVVATTARYLMVLLTTYRDPDTGNTRCGFTSRLGADAPAPRVLRLRPEDVARTGGAALEKAHFSWVTDAGRPERWIVASVGNYSVLWNFRSVKTASPEALSLGGLTTVTQYNLIAKQDAVVDAKFMHDRFARVSGRGDSAMVVATKSKVYSLEED